MESHKFCLSVGNVYLPCTMLHQCQLILYLDLLITRTVGLGLSESSPLQCSVITVADLLFPKLFVKIFLSGQETGITSGQITLCHIQQQLEMTQMYKKRNPAATNQDEQLSYVCMHPTPLIPGLETLYTYC